MTTKIPFVDLHAAHRELDGAVEDAVARVVASGWYLLGAELESFEREFADYCEVEHCVGVGSGLSALELILRAMGIGPGDEVIVPAYTWVASWTAVALVGARPVGVDVGADTYNLDPSLVEAALSERTAAIMPVHLRGAPADLDPLAEIAARHGLALIEDAAQAHGARHRGRRVGGLGAAAAFSFYPAKNLGALGDGGAVTTDDAALAERLRLLRNYGMASRYEIETAGVNSRLDELQAAVLRAKLPHLDAWNRARVERAAAYREAFAGAPTIALPREDEWADPVFHLFPVALADRDACQRALAGHGIETLIHYPVLPHRSGAFPPGSWDGGGFPVADGLAAHSLSLPLYPQLGMGALERVAAALKQAVGGCDQLG